MKYKNAKVEVLVNALNDVKDQLKSPNLYMSLLMSINSEFNEEAIVKLMNPHQRPKSVTQVVFMNVHPVAGKNTPNGGCTNCGEVETVYTSEKDIVTIFEETEPEDIMGVVSFFASDIELINKFAKEHYQLAVKPNSKLETLAKQIYQEYGKRKMAMRMGK